MNFISELAKQLSIFRSQDDQKLYINAPVEDLTELARTIMKGHGLSGEIQKANTFHITLAVYEDFNLDLYPRFLELSLPIKFNVSAAKLGSFPDAPSKPLVLIVDPDPALVRLQSDIYNLGLKLDLTKPEPNHFRAGDWHPHITLASEVKNIPEDFPPIAPVTVGVDRFVLQSDGYDNIVEINLPGSMEDRPFVTVRSNVRNEIVERITPETGIEVSHEEFMALMRGEQVIHGVTRKVLTFEDGPFAVVRHGIHIGQEGRAGERGGSQPGYRHVAGGYGYRQTRHGDERVWNRAAGDREVTVIMGGEGAQVRFLRMGPSGYLEVLETHDFPTPEEAIQLGNKYLAGAEEAIEAEQAEKREVDDEAAEEFAAREEEFELDVEPSEFPEGEQPDIASEVAAAEAGERLGFERYMYEYSQANNWALVREDTWMSAAELDSGEMATVTIEETYGPDEAGEGGNYLVEFSLVDQDIETMVAEGHRRFERWEDAIAFAEAYKKEGTTRAAEDRMSSVMLPVIGGYDPMAVTMPGADLSFANLGRREGWGATHPDRPNVMRFEDTEEGRMAEILARDPFGEEQYRVAWSEYGNDLERRLSADGFRDFDNLEEAVQFSELYVESGNSREAMQVAHGFRTGLIEDTGVNLEDAVPGEWVQGRGVSWGRAEIIGDKLVEVEVLEKAAFPEDFRDIGLSASGYLVSYVSADADTGETDISSNKTFLDARQAVLFAEGFLETGDRRQAEFAAGLGNPEVRTNLEYLPEWMSDLHESALRAGEWSVANSGADEDFGRTKISRQNSDTGRNVDIEVVRLPGPEGVAPIYEANVTYLERGTEMVKTFTVGNVMGNAEMVATLNTMDHYLNGGPPGGQVYEDVYWKPYGPNQWLAFPTERATTTGETTQRRDANDYVEMRIENDGSVVTTMHYEGAPRPSFGSPVTTNAFEDASRWLAGGLYVNSLAEPTAPAEPFPGAAAEEVGEFELGGTAPPFGGGLREPARPETEPRRDPESGAGGGLDMSRIIDDIQNSRLDVVQNSTDVDEWNDFHQSVRNDRDWESDAQGIAENVLGDSYFGGEYDEDFNPYEHLQEGQYIDEYDMEQAQERWDEEFYDQAFPEAEIEYTDHQAANFNVEVDELLDERLNNKTLADLPEILNLTEDEVHGLSTDEIERRIYNDAVGDVASEWYLVRDWNERTWESRTGEDSQMALFSDEAHASQTDRLRWNELDKDQLGYLIEEQIRENGADTIYEQAASMMDTSRPDTSDIVDEDELREQVYGSSSGGDLQYALDRLRDNNRRIVFGVDGGEVVTAASIRERSFSDAVGYSSQSLLDRTGLSQEEVQGDYLYIDYLASKRKRQGYGTELLLNVLRTASDEGKGIAGSSVDSASEFYDHLGAVWVNESGPQGGGTAFLTPTMVQRLHGFMMAVVAQQEAEEEGIERAAPNLLELLIEAEARGGVNMRATQAERKVNRWNARREDVDRKLASFTGREIVERARPAIRKPKAFYAPKEEKEYPEYFEGQEKVGHSVYGTQVFTPFLLGHIDNWEGSRQGAAMQAYHRVVGAQKAKDKEVHGFALSHGGMFVGVGSLNFSPDEKPDDKDWISVETLAISEDGHSEAAMEKVIGEAAKYNRGVFLYGGDGAEEFLTAIGMRKGENGQYHYTHEDVQQLASELKGPTPDNYISPKAKPRLRPRFGRLFEESEVKAPINREAAPKFREQQTWQARDKWERFNWEAWKDPELVWNPENQMAMGMEEQKQELFQEEVDEEREKGKSQLLNKIKDAGTNSMAFAHLAAAAAELYGGQARKGHRFLKEARDYEMEYGTEAVWPNGKIKPHDPAHYDRLLEFAGEVEGVRGDDSEGSWLDAAEFIYNRTQQAFELGEFEEGDEVRLYRGIPAGNLPETNDGGWVELDLNALSSWTFNRSTAAHVATQSGEGTLLRADVPISRIFSMWATGPGSRESMEYLILGQDGIKAWATKINRKS